MNVQFHFGVVGWSQAVLACQMNELTFDPTCCTSLTPAGKHTKMQMRIARDDTRSHFVLLWSGTAVSILQKSYTLLFRAAVIFHPTLILNSLTICFIVLTLEVCISVNSVHGLLWWTNVVSEISWGSRMSVNDEWKAPGHILSFSIE